MHEPDSEKIRNQLLNLIEKDYDGCEWFIIAANELMTTLSNTITMFKDANSSLETIKDSIGQIGLGIGNVERCLEGIEDYYNMAVELISNEMQKNNRGH